MSNSARPLGAISVVKSRYAMVDVLMLLWMTISDGVQAQSILKIVQRMQQQRRISPVNKDFDDNSLEVINISALHPRSEAPCAVLLTCCVPQVYHSA